MIFQEKQPLTSANFLWVSIVFLVFSLSAFSTKAAAEGDYPETTEATIFDGHVKASIAYTKDHAPNYTAVGDTVTVTTTLEKLDAGVLPDKFKQSSVITLFPDETQGLTLKSEPTFTYQKGVLTDQGAFVDPSKKLYQGLIGVSNFSVNLLYHDTESYAGRMTEIPITNEYDDGPYDDSYSLYNLLVDRGDKIILSYKATVTQKALQNKEFYLHSVVYDSEAGDFDWNAFLTTKMPSIQTLGVSFDSQTKNKKLDVTGLSTIKTTLTGTWSGAIADFHTNLTINGTSVSIPAGSFKDDHTFSIPVDLTKIGKMGDNQVHIEATDSNQQIANDDATITLYTTNTAPQIQLSDSILNQIIPVTPSDKFFTITGQWKDDDSLVVGVYYKLNGGSERMIQNNLLNQSKGKWTDFSEQIPLSDLRQGDNSVEVYVKDVEGAQSEVQSFDLQLGSGSVRFTAIPATVQFQSLTLNGLSLHSSTVAPIGLQIEDTTGNPQAWKLTVNQTTPFANESYELPALLSYQNGTSQVPITDQGAVTVPVTSENAKNFQLQQDADHQFDLQVAPNAYVGSYQSTLEWTIVEAP